MRIAIKIQEPNKVIFLNEINPYQLTTLVVNPAFIRKKIKQNMVSNNFCSLHSTRWAFLWVTRFPQEGQNFGNTTKCHVIDLSTRLKRKIYLCNIAYTTSASKKWLTRKMEKMMAFDKRKNVACLYSFFLADIYLIMIFQCIKVY